MITVGQEQHLGRTTLLIFLLRRTVIAVVMVFVALIAFTIGPLLATGIVGITSGGSVDSALVNNISGIISYISLLLFFVGVIIFLVGFIISLLEYRNYTFTLGEFDLKLRKGIIDQREIAIPYHQIQDIDIVRGVVQRILGVSRLVMITAGHESPDSGDQTDTVFDPIDSALAEEVRAFLERKIGVQITEGTAQADMEENTGDKISPQSASK
jgi:uncharacterized membrane protein YdbT with pleckstrin-like domain